MTSMVIIALSFDAYYIFGVNKELYSTPGAIMVTSKKVIKPRRSLVWD